MADNIFVSHYDNARPLDWAHHFQNDQALDVEIGFGLGEFLIRSAQENPDRNFIGIESDWKRLKKTLRKIERLNQVSYQSGKIENIRVLQTDAHIAFERLFREKSINCITALFPCPWPKKKHIKYRLFSHSFFKLLNSRLKCDGEIKIVTDYQRFYQWVLYEVDRTGFKIHTQVVSPRYDTKYERKWCEKGQKKFYEINLRKIKHIQVPLKEDVELKAYFTDSFIPENFKLPDMVSDVSIILKEFLYDEKRFTGMVHLIVAEESITQHVWIIITKCEKGWCIAKAQGHTALPTKGVFKAIRAVYKAVEKTQEALIPSI